MRKAIITSVLLLAMLSMSGQNIDSLLTIYDSEGRSKSIEAANRLYELLVEEEYCDSLVTFSIRSDRTAVEAQLLAPLADYLYSINRIEPALQLSQRALAAAEQTNDDASKALCYSTLTACNQQLGNYDKAIHYAELCYKADLESGKPEDISSSLNNLAVICLGTGHTEDAQQYIEKAIEIERTLNRPDVLAIRLGVAAEVCTISKEYDRALQLGQEAYDLNVSTGNSAKAAIRLCQISGVYKFKGDLDSAERTGKQALETLEKSGNIRSESICLNLLAHIEIEKGKKAEGEKYLRRAIEVARQSGGYNLQLQKAYTALAGLLKDSNPSQAVEFFERSASLRDSLFSTESERQINNFNIQYETREKEHQIELQQVQIAQQRSRQHYLFLIVALLVALIALLIVMVTQQRRHNRQLSELNAVKSKFFSIISHDLKNPVIAQKNALETICNNYDNIPADLLQSQCVELMHSSESLLDLLYNLLNWSMIETGRMSANPDRFDLKAICGDVESLMRTQLTNKHITLTLDAPQQVIVVADRNMITTVLRNLVGNAIKFSQAGSTIKITIGKNDANYTVSVTDSGTGMSREVLSSLYKLKGQRTVAGTAGERGSGLGLIVCREMVEQNGSHLTIESKEGEGTTVSFKLKAD